MGSKMPPYEFAGRGSNPLASIAKESRSRDLRFVLLTVLAAAVTLDSGLAIWKVWSKLLASPDAATSLVVFIAVAAIVPYLWTKTASERSALQRAAALDRDPVAIAIALRALYRGLFAAAMIVLLIMITLPRLL
jgi:hypothetical protein